MKAQIFIAIITYLLISIIKKKTLTAHSEYEVIQIIGASLLDKSPLREILKKQPIQDVKEQNVNN